MCRIARVSHVSRGGERHSASKGARRLVALLSLAAGVQSVALAGGTLTVKPAGTITIDGNTSDWNLAEFTTKTRGGQNQTGDTAVVGFDGGTLYYGGYWTSATLPTSASDHTAKVYSRADSSYVYFLVRCDDNQMNYAQPVATNWANDCVEFYIDPSNSGGSNPLNNSTSDVQLVIDANNRKNVYMCTTAYANQVLAGVTSAVVRDATGWWLEARIQKTALDPDLPSTGIFGVDFCFRDNDNPDATYYYGNPAQSTMYSWSDNPTGASFPTKIPDRWGDAQLPAVNIRFNATLDNGTTITVDNNSSWSNTDIGSLVVAADRTTQGDCPYSYSRKGLFKTGDRIYACNNFIAWFDYTQTDGINFAVPPYGAPAGRSGALAGWWTLDPASPNFRYWKTGPNGCWNWAHNELIPGSASPNFDQHWWDKYYTPNEHVICPTVGTSTFFFPHTAAWKTSQSQFTSVLDGLKDAAGVHYKTSCRISSWTGNIDVTDDNDANGIANYIQSDMEYLCRTDDIIVSWNFKPNNANVVSYNTFIFLWSAYAQDEDGTSCDVSATGSQWPGAVYGQPMYNQCGHTLYSTWAPYGPYSPGTTVQMQLNAACSNPYVNPDVHTSPRFAVNNGSWLRCGESPTLSINSPRWQFLNLGVPNTGSGSAADPIRFPWDLMISWNESHDGTLGFGVMSGVYTNPADYITLLSGKWYRAEYAIRTNF